MVKLSLSLSLSMGERGCETCRKWQEHYYWEHMDVSKIRFFKLMTRDFTKGISIPKKLAKKFNWTESFDLKSPNGETWNVGTSRNADELFLMSGWENFAKAHGLQENDLLVFTCSGNTYFDVLIFEASGCEKVSSLFGNRAAGPNMRRHFHNTEDWGQHAGGHNSLSDSEDTTTPSQLVGSLHHASTSKKSGGRNPKKLPPQSPNSSNNDHVKCDVIREEGSDEEHANSNYYYTRTADRLSDEEKEVIVSLASIQSDNPAFVTVLQMSHVRCKSNFLIFPSRFVADHLDSRLHEITLVRPNRKDKWCVKYCYACNGVQGIRNYTFSIFVQENRLRKGDICAFELMKGTRRVTMTVHVIRKVDGGRFVLVG